MEINTRPWRAFCSDTTFKRNAGFQRIPISTDRTADCPQLDVLTQDIELLIRESIENRSLGSQIDSTAREYCIDIYISVRRLDQYIICSPCHKRGTVFLFDTQLACRGTSTCIGKITDTTVRRFEH